jgi:HD-like signal output (HDOD) protein
MMAQLVARLARRNCTVAELQQLIERDALLTAQILRLANSAAFARMQPIHSVQHAITMVGIGAIRRFAFGSSISNLFSRFRTAPSFSMTRFNLHSVATGTLAELISDVVPVESPDGAFIAGLLHDVGKLLIAINLPKQYEEILALAAIRHDPLIECERDILGTDHAELSGMAIARWELMEPIQWGAHYHHEPNSPAALERSPPHKISLSLALHKADAFVNHLGMSVLPSTPLAGEIPSLDFPAFRVSTEKILSRFEPELRGLAELF